MKSLGDEGALVALESERDQLKAHMAALKARLKWVNTMIARVAETEAWARYWPAYLERRHKTPNELAAVFGVSPPTVTKWTLAWRALRTERRHAETAAWLRANGVSIAGDALAEMDRIEWGIHKYGGPYEEDENVPNWLLSLRPIFGTARTAYRERWYKGPEAAHESRWSHR